MAKKKKLYRAYGVVKGTKYLGEFEASSVKEAKDMALESEDAYISFCHQCSSECEDPAINDTKDIILEEVESDN